MFDSMIVRCRSYYVPHLTNDYLMQNNLCEKIRGQENTYKLFNPFNYTSNYLRVIAPQEDNPSVKIVGSIRKWYYGNTLDDLSRFDYEDAWKQVFSLLAIPLDKMKYFYIAKAEIGLNISTKVPCSEITNAIIGYKSSCYKLVKREGEGCKYKSRTNQFSINLYDKIVEITAPFKKKRVKSSEESAILKKYEGKHSLRIEFAIGGGKVAIKKRLGFNSLDESINSFDKLFLYYWSCLQSLQFDTNWIGNINFAPDGKGIKDLKALLIITGIRMKSLPTITEWTKRMKHGRQALRGLKVLMQEYHFETNDYGEKSFFKDVKIELFHAMSKSRCLSGNVKSIVRAKKVA